MLSSLEADRVYLLDLQAQIMDLERSLSALRTEHVLVQGRLNAYKYPLLTLPDELTSEIFIHFLPIYPDPPPFTGMASPTSLTHICRHWREVALATWRAIEVVNAFDGIIRCEQRRRIRDVWIRRSGTCPLSIGFAIQTENHAISTEPFATTIPRWDHLKFYGPASFLTKLGQMPMLRSLILVVFACDIFAFYEAPQLRTVVLQGRQSTLSSILSDDLVLPIAYLWCHNRSALARNTHTSPPADDLTCLPGSRFVCLIPTRSELNCTRFVAVFSILPVLCFFHFRLLILRTCLEPRPISSPS
ncbi:hypothetical protein B0H12DRAFT_1332425 [Mycena haematopus]|nr:hypothetical protein B0H12DRAFT_1332425 [Mycena haematopus]